ncbi:hypothetical protein [Chamaesiphon sp. VAR_69_metabat_338]|uniref:hypothetical protein n=1 Tax=Chamaesiphon sp. VAR_69_metabat_338 TaxID=2964704 RepID=UPI00286DED13|nr:hypothetical protein [Chamaesiphon sp. VAR_69_metabat_338]
MQWHKTSASNRDLFSVAILTCLKLTGLASILPSPPVFVGAILAIIYHKIDILIDRQRVLRLTNMPLGRVSKLELMLYGRQIKYG